MNVVTLLSKKLSVLAILFMACVLTASAADFVVDDIYYNIIGDNLVELTSMSSGKYAGELVIPATVENEGITYQVTRIGNYAFYGCRDLTLVDIPEGVTEFGTYTFAYCTQLEYVDFPNSLVSIGKFAFYECSNIKGFYITRNVSEIVAPAFSACPKIEYFMCSALNTHFQVVDGVLYTKDMTVLLAYPPASLGTSFDIPETVTIIHNNALNYSANLTQVTIPESVTWVGHGAFRECDGLSSLYFPDGITHIGASGFSDCDNLTYIHLPASLDTVCNNLGGNLTAPVDLVFPRNVSYIDTYAFYEASGIKSITFEEGSQLTAIGNMAFYKCSGLETCILPNSLKTIGGEILGNCSSLKNVHLGDSITSLGRSTFWECTSLVECEIPGTVPELLNVFVKCTSLKRVKMGSKDSTPGLTMIGNCGISQCNRLEYLELGANIDSLQNLAINDLDSLKVLICWATVPPKTNSYWHAFDPYPQNFKAVLYVPKASLEAYRTTGDWQNFKTIVPIEDVGDINGDGTISIGDVTALVDMLLSGEIDRAPYCDINLDGSVTIADVTTLIDLLLGNN